uniref:BMA-DEX-1 n=2 Tax=Brugia TaxID=6278 RepID=A0A0I9NAV6_BRUMA|nr:BMA-DEX-1 [Brugia malayi]
MLVIKKKNFKAITSHPSISSLSSLSHNICRSHARCQIIDHILRRVISEITILHVRDIHLRLNMAEMRWYGEHISIAVCPRLTFLSLLLLVFFCWISKRTIAMRLNPERIAARLQIEREMEMDKLVKMGRNRRQLATPKEISISVFPGIAFPAEIVFASVAILDDFACTRGFIERKDMQPTSMKWDKIPLKTKGIVKQYTEKHSSLTNRITLNIYGHPITAPLFSSRLFDYGPDVGDQELPRNLDVAEKINLIYPLRFYGVDTSTIYILSNGGIGIESNTRTYQQNVLPSNLKLIAPFWNRNDLRNGGSVYFREVAAGRVLERGQSEIRYQYDEVVKVKACLLVTWDKMQPVGAAPLPDDNTNTFQIALFITDNGTFANFIYKNIGWTQGAEAGFNKGDRKEFFALPTSGTGNIMYLEEYGNTGIPGEWMFKLGDKSVERCKSGIKGDTCDEECSAGEWGPDCALCCHCASGTCSATIGECIGGKCSDCWTGLPTCQEKREECEALMQEHCAHNAMSFTDYDRCGEPIQRCQCLKGFEGDGYSACDDIDECLQPGVCHENAICGNTPGHYFCTCADGFIGDGVSECISSLLYSYRGHQELPKDRNARVVLQLKQPLQIFGKKLDKLTISTLGIISVEDSSKVNAGDHLASSGIHGIAPFFANIDIRKGGQIFVDETDDPKVLSRATKTIASSINDKKFQAKTAVLVTYINVTDADRTGPGSTFQTLIIGGTNKQHRNETYAQMLYKDLPWGDGAEASILTYGSKNPLMLPGSGTNEIVHLSRSSNIGKPGQWLYRIDSNDVQMCLQPNLQPPYCEQYEVTDDSISVTSPTLEEIEISEQVHRSSISEVDEPTDELVEIPGPQIIHPVLIDPPTSSHIQPVVETKPSDHSSGNAKDGGWTRSPVTPHIPLISLDRQDIEDLPPDAFEVTFPPFVTVVPRLFTTGDIETGLLSTHPVGDGMQDRQPEFLATTSTILATDPVVDDSRSEVLPEVSELPPISSTRSVEDVRPVQKVKPGEIDFDNDEQIINLFRPDDDSFDNRLEPNKENEASEVSMSTDSPVQTLVQEDERDYMTLSTTSKPLFIFTTLPKKRPMPTKPKSVAAHGTSFTTAHGPFDVRNEVKVEASSSNLAVIIPTAIIAVWLLLLAVIALFCCCRRKRAERHFRDIYFPNHQQIHPITTTFAMRKDSKNFDGSYEDHLEKAARLSSELNSYNQNGRVSLYGSYWNLAGNASSSSTSGLPVGNRQSPFSQYSTQQRYIYGSRY